MVSLRYAWRGDGYKALDTGIGLSICYETISDRSYPGAINDPDATSSRDDTTCTPSSGHPHDRAMGRASILHHHHNHHQHHQQQHHHHHHHLNLHLLLLLGLCTVLFEATTALELPDFLKVCKRNDPNIEDCIKKSVEHLRPKLMTGVTEYNIPSLEPLLLKELVAAEGSNGLRITARDVKAYGASNFMIQKIRVDLETLRFALDILLPHLYIEGMYEIDGRVLLLPIRGNGPMTGNMTDATGSVKIQADFFKDELGERHLVLSEFRMRISIRKGSLNLENLFGGDPTLGAVVNNAINSNFDSFIRELQPLIEKALSAAFQDFGNNIVRPFTYDQLFPEK